MGSIHISQPAGTNDWHQDSLRCSRLGMVPARVLAHDDGVPHPPFRVVAIGRSLKLGQPLPAQDQPTRGDLKPAEGAKPATEVAGAYEEGVVQIGRKKVRCGPKLAFGNASISGAAMGV